MHGQQNVKEMYNLHTKILWSIILSKFRLKPMFLESYLHLQVPYWENHTPLIEVCRSKYTPSLLSHLETEQRIKLWLFLCTLNLDPILLA